MQNLPSEEEIATQIAARTREIMRSLPMPKVSFPHNMLFSNLQEIGETGFLGHPSQEYRKKPSTAMSSIFHAMIDLWQLGKSHGMIVSDLGEPIKGAWAEYFTNMKYHHANVTNILGRYYATKNAAH